MNGAITELSRITLEDGRTQTHCTRQTTSHQTNNKPPDKQQAPNISFVKTPAWTMMQSKLSLDRDRTSAYREEGMFYILHHFPLRHSVVHFISCLDEVLLQDLHGVETPCLLLLAQDHLAKGPLTEHLHHFKVV